MTPDFGKLILEDDTALACDAFKSAVNMQTIADRHNDEHRRKKYRRAVVLSDGSRPGEIASEAVKKLSGKFFTDGGETVDASQTSASAESAHGTFRDTLVLMFADSRSTACAPRWLALAESLFAASTGKGNLCIVCLVGPEPNGLPAGVTHLAEREYDAWLERNAERGGAEFAFVLDVQRLCRTWVRDHGISAMMLRSVNVIGPGCDGPAQKIIDALVNEAGSAKSISVGDADATPVRSYTAATEVVAAAAWAVCNGETGHVYNVVSFEASAADLKRALHRRFSDRLSLNERLAPAAAPEHRCLDMLKFNGTQWPLVRFAPEGIVENTLAKCACRAWNERFSYGENIAIYRGRLRQIKAVEMRILREIDRICEKHGIKYFLAGGTMLGAIRYGHSIPWDDDFDVGFLREDFDRFRKACDEELGAEFVHSCYYNRTKSHYVVDKIRMRGTYFSTNYSSIHANEDGVFIDILVYDATFRNRFLRFFHDKLSALLGYILQIYWMELKRRECRNTLTWWLYKAIRILPIGFYHRVFERVISIRRGCRAPEAVIDSTGKCIGSGAIRFQGLEDVRRVPFDDGFQAPVPVDPTNYLTYDYGPRYIQEPPYCKQVAPHNFARIDLGAMLFTPESNRGFRDVDVRGELFESEKTESEI